MKKRKLLDSSAMLVYLRKDKNYEKVKNALLVVQKGGKKLLMNESSIGETYWIVAQERSLKTADYIVTNVLGSLPIEPYANSYSDILMAAKLKAQYLLPYADALVLATAMKEKIPVLTGDPEFRKVEHLVKVEWIS